MKRVMKTRHVTALSAALVGDGRRKWHQRGAVGAFVVLVLTLGVSTAGAADTASSNPVLKKKTSKIYDVATKDVLQGKAELKYRGDKIEAKFKAPLPAGEVVNIWVGAYNNPEKCNGGFLGGRCSFADIFGNNEAANATLVLAASVISTGHDNIKFAITPDMSASAFKGSGQIDLNNAEIHLLARTHGAPIEGELDAQMTSWGGGCATQTCTNLKFGLFPAL